MPEEPKPSSRLIGGRYRLLERLGRGGMAEVYKAYQESLDRYVAIKFMHAFLADEPGFRQRFQREARHVAALRHPNIVQVHDFAEEDGVAYMVMELINGPTLTLYLQELAAQGKRLTLAESIHLISDVAAALTYAHTQHIVHRDIKPSNIMLETDSSGGTRWNRLVLTDFGLARLLKGHKVTASGIVTGTPAYMAPEQTLGQPGDVRADIYSLGVLLYELTTGQLPFQADSAAALILMHINQPPPSPRIVNPDLPEGLATVILQAMAKQPEDRYHTVEEMLAYLLNPEKIETPWPATTPSADVAIPPPTPPHTPHNLPLQSTSFIGRQKELAEACAILRRDGVRLLTLTGPGGTGKTRLALQAATELLPDFTDGVFFVSLAAISDQDLVISAIGQALGVKETGGRSLLAQIKTYLQDRRLLLLLDNFEQVLAAAPLVAGILATAPRLKVMATSRAALRLYGEHEFPVPPLALPDLSRLPPTDTDLVSALLPDLSAYAAVALFLERAQAAKPSFSLTRENAAAIIQICARLDGLPLAIELAAPRIKLFSPQAILARLNNRLVLLTGGARDLPARQQTLRGAIEWGYDLLDPAEKTLFAQLAVFVGGFTLEAIEAVIGNWLLAINESQYPITNNQYPILDTVASLVDNSLLRQEEGPDGEPRFRMLETIHDYALERLVESSTAGALRRRHAAYYLELAETAGPQLKGWRQMGWLDRLEIEHDNLRTTFTTLLAWGEIETALRLGAALWRFWLLRGYLSEGIKWLEMVISHWRSETKDLPISTQSHSSALSPQSSVLSPLPAHVLHGAGVLHCDRGQCADAESLLRQSLALFQVAGDTLGAAYSRNDLGFALLSQGNYAEAISLCQESLASFRPLGDTWGTAAALNNLGLAALSQGDAAQTTQLCQESLALFQKLGDRWGMALALNNLGLAALPQGDYERATWLCEQSLVLFRELGGKT